MAESVYCLCQHVRLKSLSEREREGEVKREQAETRTKISATDRLLSVAESKGEGLGSNERQGDVILWKRFKRATRYFNG